MFHLDEQFEITLAFLNLEDVDSLLELMSAVA
jgi:hypothetical protein